MSKATQTQMSKTETDGTQVTVSSIRKTAGIAGQVTVTARVSYVFDDGSTDTSEWQLVGHVHGGPVVAVMSSGRQVFVRDAERFGSFGADPIEYMRRYALGLD